MCQSFLLRSEQNDIVVGRSMEFPLSIDGVPVANWNACYVPKGTAFNSAIKKQGMHSSWVAQYNYIGITGLDEKEAKAFGDLISLENFPAPFLRGTFATEGVNENGLSASLLTYDANMVWSVAPAEGVNIYYFLLVDYILGTFGTVAELRNELQGGRLNIFGLSGGAHANEPCHYIVHDATGDSLVIEVNNGTPVLYDKAYLQANKLDIFCSALNDTLYGQMTNAPGYDWHFNNLRQYLHLSPNDPEKPRNGNMVQTSHGAGMIGLPGDYTSPSRFVRLSNILLHVPQPKNLAATFILANHMLNTATIIDGMVNEATAASLIRSFDITDWVTVKLLANDAKTVMYARVYNALPFDKQQPMYQEFNFHNFPSALQYVPLVVQTA